MVDKNRRWGRRTLTLVVVIAIAVLSAYFGVQYCRITELSTWQAIVKEPEPESCSLCGKNGDGTRYHAPCLLNLSTGVLGELTVYDPDRFREGEIAEHQQTGVMSLLHCGEFTALRDADAHNCHVYVPKSSEVIDPALFCQSCRAILAKVATDGYVLVDLYDLDSITAYSVADGANHEIRDYSVSIAWNKEMKELAILVQGNLFLE